MTERKETIKAFLIRTLADPVLIYAVIAMMSIMTHYRRTEMWIYGIWKNRFNFVFSDRFPILESLLRSYIPFV